MQYDEAINKEKIQQDLKSPCIVSDDELMARLLFSPNHFDENGSVTTMAFECVMKKEGLSVLRLKYDFENCKQKTIEIIGKNTNKSYEKYICAKAKDIRDICYKDFVSNDDMEKRIFYIVDELDKDKEIIGHANIYSTRKLIEATHKKHPNIYIKRQIQKVFLA